MYTCPKCQDFEKTAFCLICHRCLKHRLCTCVQCRVCGERTKDYCSRCLRCHKHHLTLPADFKVIPFMKRGCVYRPKSTPITHTLNPLQRALGLELESSNWHKLDEVGLGSGTLVGNFVHDGSVKPSELELNIAPVLGDTYFKMIEDLEHKYTTHKPAVNETCGFHVHVDAPDLTWLQIKKLVYGYSLIQHTLYGPIIDPARKDNVFCRPINPVGIMNTKTSAGIMSWFYRWLYALDPNLLGPEDFKSRLAQISNNKYLNTARRQALNMHSWVMRGTVEFRLHEGTNDMVSIQNWPLLCGWMVESLTSGTLVSLNKLAARGPDLNIVHVGEHLKLPSDLQKWIIMRYNTYEKLYK